MENDSAFNRRATPERLYEEKEKAALAGITLEAQAEAMNAEIAWGFIKNDPKLKDEIEAKGGWPLAESVCDDIGVRRGLDAVQVAAAAMALHKKGGKTVH